VQDLHSNLAYSGCALTLIDALSTLAVIGDRSNFETSVNWLLQNVSLPVNDTGTCSLISPTQNFVTVRRELLLLHHRRSVPFGVQVQNLTGLADAAADL